MDFKVGEKVRFLHDKQEGVIQQLLKGGEAEVLVDDFVEMVVSLKDLVKIHRGEKNLKKEEEQKEDVPPKQVSKLPAELVIVRKEGTFEMWILNPGDFEIFYTLHLRIRGKVQALAAGRVFPQENEFLKRIDKGDLFDSKMLHVQALVYRQSKDAEVIPPINLQIPLKVKVLKLDPKPIEELKAEGHRFVLATEKPIEQKLPPSVEVSQKPQSSYMDQPEEIVDLHIEKLVKNQLGMNSDTMLQIQIEEFEKKLSGAILYKKPRIIFIHGIGTGKLKREIHRRLDENQFVRNFRLADPVKYGNGATEVEFT